MKRLIITGDDFGLSHEVNEEIERLHLAGVLTRASLMVHEAAVEEAVRIARRNPLLGVNLHLTLCAGRAPAGSPLAGSDGRFAPSPAAAGVRYAFDWRLRSVLDEEISAQFDRFRDLGFAAERWDGHTHLHLHPVIMKLTIPIAEVHGFTSTRLIREVGSPYPLAFIFQLLGDAAVPSLRRAGIHFPDHVLGLRETGQVATSVFRTWIEQLPAGSSEIYFHPGAEPRPIDPIPIRCWLEEAGVELLSDLPPAPARSGDPD